MPAPVQRPVNKSFLPMQYDSDDEDDSLKDDPDRFENQQLSNIGGGEEYHFDEGEDNWVPKSV